MINDGWLWMVYMDDEKCWMINGID